MITHHGIINTKSTKGASAMGVYLNSKTAYTLYKGETQKPYFTDKSKMLKDLFPLVETGNSHVCITRPRRFGKTVMANMISSYFSRACDAQDIFDRLQIAQDQDYLKYKNQYSVIHISFHELGGQCSSYSQYINRIQKRLLKDLKKEYPQTEPDENESLSDFLLDIYAEDDSARFIFIFDEWDFIFHQDFITQEDKKSFLIFLRDLLKDKPYVRLAYMTGILPIAKYSSGSELNMFAEYTMVSEERFSEYFGFTEQETDRLFAIYQLNHSQPQQVTREGIRYWYNGYRTKGGEKLYNPRSVVMALSNNNLGNYWTSSGPYDEIYYYIENNTDAVRDELARLISGEAVSAKICEYAATSQNLKTKEEIFSAMVVYGFLSYEKGTVMIPNHELMEKYSDMLRREPSFGYIYRLAKESERMLQATLAGDTKTMEEVLSYAHDTEIPLLSYNSEAELSAVVNLVYLAARDRYRVEREEKAGKGYADFIFYPQTDPGADGIILELKVDHTPEEAVRQIIDKKYALRFAGKPGEKQKYTGRILAVGISYDKKRKKHRCKVEVLKKESVH